MWNYIIDGLLILIIVVCAIIGIVKGFFDSILSLVGTGLALAVSVFTAKYVANFINKIFNFEEFLLTKIDEATTEGVITIFGVDLQNTEVAKFAVWVVSIIIVFIIVKLAIFILSKIFESVVKNSPTMGGINRVLGMVFGIVKGGVTVLGLLAVCSLLAQVPGIGTPIYEQITNTTITSGIYKYVDEFVEKNLTKENIQDIIERFESEVSNNDDQDPTSGSTASSGSSSDGTSVATNNTLLIEETN